MNYGLTVSELDLQTRHQGQKDSGARQIATGFPEPISRLITKIKEKLPEEHTTYKDFFNKKNPQIDDNLIFTACILHLLDKEPKTLHGLHEDIADFYQKHQVPVPHEDIKSAIEIVWPLLHAMNLIKIMAHDHEEAGIYNKNDAAVEHMLFSRKIAVTDPDYKNPLNGESPRVKLPKKASD